MIAEVETPNGGALCVMRFRRKIFTVCNSEVIHACSIRAAMIAVQEVIYAVIARSDFPEIQNSQVSPG